MEDAQETEKSAIIQNILRHQTPVFPTIKKGLFKFPSLIIRSSRTSCKNNVFRLALGSGDRRIPGLAGQPVPMNRQALCLVTGPISKNKNEMWRTVEENKPLTSGPHVHRGVGEGAVILSLDFCFVIKTHSTMRHACEQKECLLEVLVQILTIESPLQPTPGIFM